MPHVTCGRVQVPTAWQGCVRHVRAVGSAVLRSVHGAAVRALVLHWCHCYYQAGQSLLQGRRLLLCSIMAIEALCADVYSVLSWDEA